MDFWTAFAIVGSVFWGGLFTYMTVAVLKGNSKPFINIKWNVRDSDKI